MLSESKIYTLTSLDRKILECERCSLYKNGRTIPYWTDKSRYMAILEAPGKDEVEKMTPTVGTAGRWLWEFMEYRGLKKEMFSIINSVNCRPVDGNKNGKPTPKELEMCSSWLKFYIKVLQPEKIMLFGAYAVKQILGITSPIKSINSKIFEQELYEHKTKIVVTVHPAYASIYAKQDGDKLIAEAIQSFKEC
jgi:uracil-DNA glycosylase